MDNYRFVGIEYDLEGNPLYRMELYLTDSVAKNLVSEQAARQVNPPSENLGTCNFGDAISTVLSPHIIP